MLHFVSGVDHLIREKGQLTLGQRSKAAGLISPQSYRLRHMPGVTCMKGG